MDILDQLPGFFKLDYVTREGNSDKLRWDRHIFHETIHSRVCLLVALLFVLESALTADILNADCALASSIPYAGLRSQLAI